MIFPSSLVKGDCIGVTAPSAGCETAADLAALNSGIRHFNALGYPVIVTENVRNSYKGRSSDKRQRAAELKQLFADRSVRAVIAAHGGDYLVEMLPYVDFEALQKDPKWVQGYSDNTGLTFTITTNLDIATIYSYNFSTFGMEQWHTSLINNLKILEGINIIQESYDRYQDGYFEKVTGMEAFRLEKQVEWKNLYPAGYKEHDNGGFDSTTTSPVPESGKYKEHNNDGFVFKGRALGGCLDVLLYLVGTRFDRTKEFIEKYKDDKILWYLESFDLSSESLVRGLWQLREAGWFNYAAGFLFGRPAMYDTGTDTTYEEAVLSVLGDYNLPIIIDMDIGHKPPQFTMVNGAIAEVRSKDGEGSIAFDIRRGRNDEITSKGF